MEIDDPLRIYLACPYSHHDKGIRRHRFFMVSQTAAQLINQGFCVFSPVTCGHILGESYGMPAGFGFWREYDLSFLRHWARELWVMRLVGWEQSEGVQAEIEEARRLGLPMRFLN